LTAKTKLYSREKIIHIRKDEKLQIRIINDKLLSAIVWDILSSQLILEYSIII
jgi:hypothetical protein